MVYKVMATIMHVILGYMFFMDFIGVAIGSLSFLEIQTCNYHYKVLLLFLC